MANDELRKKVFDIIDSKQEEYLTKLSELISIPSVCGDEASAQDYMKNLYQNMGLKVELFQADHDVISKHPAFVESGLSYEGRPNVVGKLAGSGGGKSLVLNGHIDVVSVEPVSAWQYPPWQGTRVGNKLYGRGSVDMKAGLMANYFALRCLIDAGIKPKGDIMLQSVVEEEAGGGPGSLALMMAGFTADAMVVPEPRPTITVAMTGVLYFRVKVVGKTAHAGLAHLGLNAIGKMNKIYDALIALDEKRANERHNPIFEKYYPRSTHLNIGTYKAGDWASTVAGMAEIECRISFIPGETMASVKQEVADAIQAVVAGDEWLQEHQPEVIWYGWQTDPWQQDATHPFITTFQQCAEEIYGPETELSGRTSGLDVRFSQYYNMQALTFGPNGGNYHGIDEYVEIDSSIKVIKVLAAFIMDWCGV